MCWENCKTERNKTKQRTIEDSEKWLDRLYDGWRRKAEDNWLNGGNSYPVEFVGYWSGNWKCKNNIYFSHRLSVDADNPKYQEI